MNEQPYDWEYDDGPVEFNDRPDVSPARQHLLDSMRRAIEKLDEIRPGWANMILPEYAPPGLCDLTSDTALQFYRVLVQGGYEGEVLDGLRTQIDGLIDP